MDTLYGIVNFLLVPFISLRIFYNRRGLKPEPVFNALITYAVFAACNLPFTKLLVYIIKPVLGRKIEADTGAYTVIAIAAALISPYIVELWKGFFSLNLSIKRRESEKGGESGT